MKRNLFIFIILYAIYLNANQPYDPIYQNNLFSSRAQAIKTKYTENLVNGNSDWNFLGPKGGRISCIVTATNTDSIIVGTWSGGTFKTLDGAQSWEPFYTDNNSYQNQEIQDIHQTDNYTFIANVHGIYKNQAYSVTWEKVITSVEVMFTGVHVNPQNPEIIYASTYSYDGIGNPRGFIISQDGGQTWTEHNNGLSNTSIVHLVPSRTNADQMYLCTREGLFYTDSTGYSGWQKISPEFETKIAVSFCQSYDDSAHLFLGTLDGCYETTDHGKYWQKVNIPDVPHPQIRAIEVGRNNVHYVGTDKGLFIRKADQSTFINASSGLQNKYVTAINAFDNNIVYLGTMDGFYKSSDGGTTWQRKANGMNATFCHSIDSDSCSTWIGTKYAGIYKLQDNEWEQPQTNRQNAEIKQVVCDPNNPCVLAAYCDNFNFQTNELLAGVLSITPDSCMEHPINNTVVESIALQNNDPNRYFITTRDGLYNTTDGGTSFTPMTGLPKIGFFSICQNPFNPNSFYAGSEFNNVEAFHGIYKSNDSGDTWNYFSYKYNIYEILDICPSQFDSNLVFAANSIYGILQTRDNGVTWKTTSESHPEGCPTINAVVESSAKPGWLFAGGNACYYSNDFGQHWTIISPLPDGAGVITDLHIPDFDPHTLYATTTGRGVISIDFSETLVMENTVKVNQFKLYPNYPNPFNSENTIVFDLPEPETVSLQIFNITGRAIYNKEFSFSSGNHTIKWNGKSKDGKNCPSGVYIIKFSTNSQTAFQKTTLIR